MIRIPSEPAPSRTQVCPYREFAAEQHAGRCSGSSAGCRATSSTHTARRWSSLIRESLRATRYDLVIASEIDDGRLLPVLPRRPGHLRRRGTGHSRAGPTIRGAPAWERARRKLTWTKHTRFLTSLLENFALCTVVSEVERRLLSAAVPGYNAIHVVPNSVSAGLDGEQPERVPDSLIFTGSLRFASESRRRHVVPRTRSSPQFGQLYPERGSRLPETRDLWLRRRRRMSC